MRALLLLALATACSAELAPRLVERVRPVADERPSTAAVVQLGVGTSHTCALHADGTVSCWGANDSGQLGVTGTDRRLYPIAVSGVRGAVELTVADSTTCVRYADGRVDCWGHLGEQSQASAPVALTAGIARLAGRCFLRTDGRVECLRANAQLVELEVDRVVSVAAWNEHGCVAREDGGVKCWVQDKWFDVAVKDVVEVAAESTGMCGRTRHGAVFCWTVIDVDELSLPVLSASDARGLLAGHLSICARKETSISCWEAQRHEIAETLAGVAPDAALALGFHRCYANPGSRDVRCSGNGLEGELGNGWWRRRPVPTRVVGLENVVEIAMSQNGTAPCARHADGTVSCWGNYPSGALATPKKLALERVRALVPSETVRAVDEKDRMQEINYQHWYERDAAFRVKQTNVAMASDHCFVEKAGRLRCWGAYVERDPKDRRWSLTPRIDDAVEVTSYSDQGLTCARRRAGQVVCFEPGSDIVDEMPIADAIEIGGAEFSTCAIRADRSLWCWGSTSSMLFSQRPSPEDVAPTRVPVGEVATMSIVRDLICVVRTAGTVACWGNNDEGQLGDGTFMPRTRPADVLGITDAVDVAVGLGIACAVHRDGGVSCWGAADRGQLGTFVMSDVTTPVSVVWP